MKDKLSFYFGVFILVNAIFVIGFFTDTGWCIKGEFCFPALFFVIILFTSICFILYGIKGDKQTQKQEVGKK